MEYQKYLKYKTKYLQLKTQSLQLGGATFRHDRGTDKIQTSALRKYPIQESTEHMRKKNNEKIILNKNDEVTVRDDRVTDSGETFGLVEKDGEIGWVNMKYLHPIHVSASAPASDSRVNRVWNYAKSFFPSMSGPAAVPSAQAAVTSAHTAVPSAQAASFVSSTTMPPYASLQPRGHAVVLSAMPPSRWHLAEEELEIGKEDINEQESAYIQAMYLKGMTGEFKIPDSEYCYRLHIPYLSGVRLNRSNFEERFSFGPSPIRDAAYSPLSVLPAGWFQTVDRASGRRYYYNRDTGQTTWDLPVVSSSVHGALPRYLQPAQSAQPAQPAQPVLLSGWLQKVDSETGRTYYYNPDTDKTTWNLPVHGASFEFLEDIAKAVYVPPLEPGGMPVVQMRIPGKKTQLAVPGAVPPPGAVSRAVSRAVPPGGRAYSYGPSSASILESPRGRSGQSHSSASLKQAISIIQKYVNKFSKYDYNLDDEEFAELASACTEITKKEDQGLKEDFVRDVAALFDYADPIHKRRRFDKDKFDYRVSLLKKMDTFR
jgi:hypothetical protein